MPGTSRIEQTPEATVVVKEATGADAKALREEGERLAAAAHPGVVRLLSSTGDDSSWQLRTAHSGRPLSVCGALEARSLATIAAAVATTLADLHAMGLSHGRLSASHILLGPNDRPVICGLGRGSGESTPGDDVGALGQIVLDQLSGDQTLEPIPERRWSRRRRWDGWARATLMNLAEQACADPPSRRPSARRFAATISEAFDVAEPSHRPPAHAAASWNGPELDDDPIEALRSSLVVPPRPIRHMPVRAVAGLASVVLGVALVVHSSTGTASLTAAPPTSLPAATGMIPAAEPTTTAQPTPRPAAPMREASPRPHRCPGSACAPDDGVTVDGRVVTTRSGRYQIGRDGDSIVVGDWDCDGVVTPAALRPATGEVFVFPRWAGDAEITVGPVRTVPEAAALEAVPGDGGCAGLRVITTSGRIISVTRAASR